MSAALRDILQSALGDGFRLERELGGGGMSRVFIARDLALDRDVVVKVLSAESSAGVSADRFRREIQLIAKLQHPHVVPIISAGAAEGVLYYVMPFMGGETMRARLTREGPLPIADAARILREILDALSFAHRHGVIHRDIKPENVLLEAGHAVMADFGIAKALRESGPMTSVGVSLGTPAYMAPEQATADPTADHRADLYAVGVLAYEFLVGTPPFTGSAQQLIVAHLTTPAPALKGQRSDVPDALAELVARALEKDPAARPQSAQEMLVALDSAVTPTATTPQQAATGALGAAATGSARLTTATGAGRSKRTMLLAGAGAVALIAIAIAGVSRARAAAPTVVDGAELIAVMPLSAVSDTSLARLGTDLVVTLSTNFDGVGNLRTVDAVTLLMRARKLSSPLPLAEAQALAAELGAKSVLTGTLISEGNLVRATVVLNRVGADSALAKATALAAPRDLGALTDSLTWSVLRQVWRRGAAPSPVLAGLATPSFDALRAFLDGERHFQRLEVTAAMAAYRTAIERDSNFVQALLRYDYVRSWSLLPQDPEAHARLLALKDRLPERERLWLETSELVLPVPEKIELWKSLATRFSDYPPVLMSAADLIIHSGPLYGVPITDAQPLLDRLDEIVPDHADTKFHLAMVARQSASTEVMIRALEVSGAAAGPPWSATLAFEGRVLRALQRGAPPPPASEGEAAGREFATIFAGDPSMVQFVGLSMTPAIPASYRLEVLEDQRKKGVYSGEILAGTSFGEGHLRIAMGDWAEGLQALRRVEPLSLPMTLRASASRLAALGAWLGAVAPSTADSALQRLRALPGSASGFADRAEQLWIDGLLGVLLDQPDRTRSALATLRADTSLVLRQVARSLEALRMDRAGIAGAADSAMAVSDEVMRDGGFLMSVEAVNRLIAARALVRRGQPERAERYLRWTDAGSNNPRTYSAIAGISFLTAYERGKALDAAGRGDAAAYQFRKFLTNYTSPPEAHRALVEDATQRLARIEGAKR